MRPDVRAMVDALLAASAPGGEVSLDAIGDAIGTRAIGTDGIEAIIDALEAEGRRVVGVEREAGRGWDDLRSILVAARALEVELGRRATRAEIAARCGLSEDAIRHALALAKVVQR